MIIIIIYRVQQLQNPYCAAVSQELIVIKQESLEC